MLDKVHIWCIFTPLNARIYGTTKLLSLTKPNNEWLKSQVQSEEYSSKSELVNDLIRQARLQQSEVDWIRTKLIKAEERLRSEGHTAKSMDTILSEIKDKARRDGHL